MTLIQPPPTRYHGFTHMQNPSNLINKLTLYLKAGAIEWPLLAISAPVLRGVTFEGSKINDNSFLYIYLKVLYPTGPKMIYKKFESCIIDQGVKLKYQKLNIIFNSEVIMSCKLSK